MQTIHQVNHAKKNAILVYLTLPISTSVAICLCRFMLCMCNQWALHLYPIQWWVYKANHTRGIFCCWRHGNIIIRACCAWISNATFYKLLENKQLVYFQATCRMYHAIFPCAAHTNNDVAVSPVTKVASCMVGLRSTCPLEYTVKGIHYTILIITDKV